jgi:hypothetical protein
MILLCGSVELLFYWEDMMEYLKFLVALFLTLLPSLWMSGISYLYWLMDWWSLEDGKFIYGILFLVLGIIQLYTMYLFAAKYLDFEDF